MENFDERYEYLTKKSRLTAMRILDEVIEIKIKELSPLEYGRVLSDIITIIEDNYEREIRN